jgi:hypothetical protein
MIDWSKEKAVKNFCGYCDGTPTGSSCDGSCFKESYTDKAKTNRVEHALEMLERIPKQIEQLEIKEQEYKDALSA